MESKKQTVLALVAHPDDAEFLCAGALALLQQSGWRVVIGQFLPAKSAACKRTWRRRYRGVGELFSANILPVRNGTDGLKFIPPMVRINDSTRT